LIKDFYLPNEIIKEIFYKLEDFKTLRSLNCVCKIFEGMGSEVMVRKINHPQINIQQLHQLENISSVIHSIFLKLLFMF
jgi:hypothetical protein